MHREHIRLRRNGVSRDGEPAQHPRVIVTHLLEEVVVDDRVGFRRRAREMRGGHPVDEIPLEHRGVARDDPAPFVRGEPGRVGARRQEVLDGAVDVAVKGHGARLRGSDDSLPKVLGHGPLKSRIR